MTMILAMILIQIIEMQVDLNNIKEIQPFNDFGQEYLILVKNDSCVLY